ncbi:DNA polymerase alpha, subunit B [Durotheca rogersii]|uniref:DNA polymerase alpha, subunit B n=1 Tax=Durotheca rogersii TaxID=419775 RepID=UPI0022212180|nr:DNA polymerase alpha, subunit B [Durotheca rogersii]KAI5862737.1 DNA polymerase alpha, subunit B [Durotheca rogersii]
MAEIKLQELNDLFLGTNKILEPDVVSELQSIMQMHSLTAQDLYFKWESYCIKMDMDGRSPSVDDLRALKQDILDALERNNRTHQVHVKSEKRLGGATRTTAKGDSGVYRMLEGMVPHALGSRSINNNASQRRDQLEGPSVTRVRTNISGISPGQKTPLRTGIQLKSVTAYSILRHTRDASVNDRRNPGEVLEVLNGHLDLPESPVVPYGESRIKLTATSDQRKLGYKTLAMKSSEASEILDDRIDGFEAMIKRGQNIDESEFGSAASQGTTGIVAVGRIASDSSEGKLNVASLVLETSRHTGGGLRVPLNLQKLNGRYQFFPGQIVAFRGINTSGREFMVQEVLAMPLLPSAASTPAVIETHRDRLRGGLDAMHSDGEPAPLNIFFGAGPYTSNSNLDFESLHALCRQAADSYADALILTGPFIDIDHPLISTGDFDLPEDVAIDPDVATMATIFKYFISSVLNRLVASNPTITILLVPSVRDIIARHVSWPQEPFPRKDLGLVKAVRIIGNPMTLSINEMVLGISSQDVLWDLHQQELTGGRPIDPDPLSRASRYLIQQRHYFPVFPPADRQKLSEAGAAEGLPIGAVLDTSYLKLGEIIDVRPDVLILPSALAPFAKVVDSVLVINPGYLSRAESNGTYARMVLYPPKLMTQQLSSGGMASHRVFERARVEIVRI